MKAYSQFNKDNAWRSLNSRNLLNKSNHLEHSANSLFVAIWGGHQHESSDKKLGLGRTDISWMGWFRDGNPGSFVYKYIFILYILCIRILGYRWLICPNEYRILTRLSYHLGVATDFSEGFLGVFGFLGFRPIVVDTVGLGIVDDSIISSGLSTLQWLLCDTTLAW